MATITADAFLDGGTARTAGESWTLNGGKLTVRTDTRWHANAPASMLGSIGAQTISATLGGGVLVDARNIRWMAYNTGTGNVPAIGTTVTQGGISGYLLGVWASLTAAPTAVGAAMPASGFLKFREVTGGNYAAGALTGIGASAVGADVLGWLEHVQDISTAITTSRKGTGHQTRGGYFYLDNTNGSIGQVLQVPTNGGGSGTQVPGVEIETGVGTGVYEFYPALSSLAANGWSHLHIGAPEGGPDRRQRFVKGLGTGQMQIGETFTQASTYASISQASTYTWANNLVTVTFASHGLSVGDQVYLDFTSGGATADGVYTVETVPGTGSYIVALTGAGTAGNVTGVSRSTITFVAHGLSPGQTIYCDATSGTLVDGQYEIMGAVVANSYVINTPIAPGATGNVTVRFTIGFVPVSGCKTRVGNVFLRQTSSANRALNLVPHATVGSRPTFTTTGAGVVDHEYAYGDWYYSLSQAYNVILKNCSTFDRISLSEIASAFTIENTNAGMAQSLDTITFAMTSCFAGGTITDCKFQRGNSPATNDHAIDLSLCRGQVFTRVTGGIVQTPRSSGKAFNASQCASLTFNDCTAINGGALQLVTCSDITINNWNHVARYIGVENVANTGSAIDCTVKCARIKIDGFAEGWSGAIPRNHAPGAILSSTASDDITLRNAGTRASPLGNSLTHNTRTHVFNSGGNNNGIKLQRVYVTGVRTALIVDLNSDKNMTYESVMARRFASFLPNTQIIAGLNAIARGCAASLTSVAANASVYGTHFMDWFTAPVRNLGTYTWASSLITVTTVANHGLQLGEYATLQFTSGGLSSTLSLPVRSITSATVFVVDYPTSGTSGNVIVYPRITTVADNLTQAGVLSLPMNEATAETASSVTLTGSAAFTSAPGLTLPASGDEAVIEMQHFAVGHTGFYVAPPVLTGILAVQASTYTWAANVLTVTFTAHGYAVGDQVYLDFTSGGGTPDGVYTIAGITSANVYTITLTGSGTAGNVSVYRLFNIRYQIRTPSADYSGTWENLWFQRPGSSTSGSAVISMADTTGVAVGDYIYGIALSDASGTYNSSPAKVLTVDSGTQITMTRNALATNANQLLTFSALPNESISAADGFKMKVSIKADTPGRPMALTYLTIPTTTTAASQDNLYPLDTIALTLTGLQAGSDVVVRSAGTTTILDSADAVSSYSFIYETPEDVDIFVHKAGYIPFSIRDYALGSTDASVPVAQVVDRAYIA